MGRKRFTLGRFSVENSVLVNILMITLLLLGSISLARMPREQFAEVPFYWVNVIVPVPGFSAVDIEEQILIPVEQEMEGLDSLKQIQSTANEGVGVVRVEFDSGISSDEFNSLFQDVRTRFSRVELPDEALAADIDDFSSNDFLPVVEVVLYGDLDPRILKETADLVSSDLLEIKDLSGIDAIGNPDPIITIQADAARLTALGLSLDQLVGALGQQNSDIPAGNISDGRSEYLVRTQGGGDTLEDLRQVILRRGREGSGIIHVGDVAVVARELDSEGVKARYNGQPAVFLRVLKDPGGDSIGILDGMMPRLENWKSRLPAGIEMTLVNDSTLQIRDSLSVLVKNAGFGLILLVIILFLFVGLRNALMTALGIPVTFAITFVILELLGETFNSNTLFGMVLVLGMIVDHAIVITENSYRFQLMGMNKKKAAIKGVNQVVIPVIAATATTIAAFVPLMILPGTIGKFLRIIPLTVTIALAVSTFEALIFLPSHYADWPGGNKKPWELLSFETLQKGFSLFIEKLYKRRKLVTGLSVLIMVLLLSLAAFLKQDLFSGEDYTYFYIDIQMPPGTPLEKTEEVLSRFEEKILPLVGNNEIQGISSYAGLQTGSSSNAVKGNLAQIIVDLKEKKQGRERSISAIMSDIQVACSDIPGADSIRYRKVQSGPPVDAPVSFRLFGDSYEDLSSVSTAIREQLASYPELFNIKDNFEAGTPEIQITVNNERAATYGLTAAAVGRSLRAGIAGVTAATLYKDNEELEVIVSLKDGQIQSPRDLERFTFTTPDGRTIPFSAVCRLDYGRSPAAVKRVDGKREITIEAEAYTKDNIPEINKDIEEFYNRTYKTRYPGMEFSVGGEFAEFNDLLIQILRIFLLGIFAIYIILGTQFKSYTQPFLILFSVPLSFAGVILYLFLSRTPFSTTVLYAGVALAGIAVNDAIVLISFINERRADGVSIAQAVKEGAVTRLRPIVLTSLTTIAGLLPTAIGIGGRSPVWQPMAWTIIFGLLFSTATALIFIPSLYGVLFDRKKSLPSKPSME